jgi:hypothetical protein
MFEAMTDFIEAYNLDGWASMIGLVVALVGFFITIRDARRSKKAAEAAREAVQDVREDIARANAVADFASAVASMEEVKRLSRERAWTVLLDRYAAVRKTLISIKGGSDLTDAQQSQIQNAITQFRKLEVELERGLESGGEPVGIAARNRIVSKQVDALQELLTDLKANIGRNDA